jgi:hypothetical protein
MKKLKDGEIEKNKLFQLKQTIIKRMRLNLIDNKNLKGDEIEKNSIS